MPISRLMPVPRLMPIPPTGSNSKEYLNAAFAFAQPGLCRKRGQTRPAWPFGQGQSHLSSPLFSIPDSRFPIPDSLGALTVVELNSPRVAPLPTPYSLLPTPYSLQLR
ncbi:hypothetical protein [Moorena sp. SIO4G3]|uniref:hypothetical protein n=1 Tax=Moorena sp. SIO4G3 TaxID=2607821 RepID=UPI0025FD957D|nr:hypothetical protein [Moorena sp. SIO4G3]